MKFAHITITTAKLEQSVEFYRNVAGLEIQQEMKNGPAHIVFMANGQGETAVELIEDKNAAFYKYTPSIGFQVENVEEYHKKLTESGYNPTPLVYPAPGVKFFFVQDPNGIKVQLI